MVYYNVHAAASRKSLNVKKCVSKERKGIICAIDCNINIKIAREKMLVAELYDGITKDWPQFQLNKKAVRHTLSANCFFYSGRSWPEWSCSLLVGTFSVRSYVQQRGLPSAGSQTLVQHKERQMVKRQEKRLNSSQNATSNTTESVCSSIPYTTTFTSQQLHQLQCQIQLYQQLHHHIWKPQQAHYNKCQQDFTYQEHQISQQPHQHYLFDNNQYIELHQSHMRSEPDYHTLQQLHHYTVVLCS